MKSKWILYVLLATTPIAAQEYANLQDWMKATAAAQNELKKEKTGTKAVAQAEKLGAIYENMIGFWRERVAQGAVKYSEQGKAAAVALASAANSNNTEAADAALKDLGATCTGCHTQYRVKAADGKYHIR